MLSLMPKPFLVPGIPNHMIYLNGIRPGLHGPKGWRKLLSYQLVTHKAFHARETPSHKNHQVVAEFPKFNLDDQQEIGISQTVSKCLSVSKTTLITSFSSVGDCSF